MCVSIIVASLLALQFDFPPVLTSVRALICVFLIDFAINLCQILLLPFNCVYLGIVTVSLILS